MPGPIHIIMSRGGHLGSAVIRAYPPRSRWSHCGVMVGDDVIEARAFKGVVPTPLAEFKERSSAWEIIRLWTPRPESGDAWALSTVGARYDWGGVFGIPFADRDWSNEGQWYCSEHAAIYTRKAGNPVHKVEYSPGVTPGHLESLLHAADGRVVERGGRA